VNDNRLPKAATDMISRILGLILLASAPASAQTLVIRNGNVVDVVKGRVRAHQDVVISGGNIVAVGRSQLRADVKTIDATGRYIMPGLWDMHVHVDEAALRALLRYGITSARDMGNSDVTEVLALRQLSVTDAAVPHLFIAGPRLSGADFPSDDSLRVLGVDFFKIHEGVPPQRYYGVIRRAKQLGYDVVGHVPAELTPAEVSQAGQRSIEHLDSYRMPVCRSSAALPSTNSLRSAARPAWIRSSLFLRAMERGSTLQLPASGSG
jgi:hypothetical protein